LDTIELIFKKEYKQLCILSYFYLKDIDEAEDVVQDIFVKIIEQNKYEELRNIKSYLKTAVRNASLKHIQKKKEVSLVNEYQLFYNQSFTEEQEKQALNNKLEIYKKLNLLPEQCKLVFLLCVIDGLKYKEAADFLNISVNTVKTQMKKAYKILRESLADAQFILFLFSKN
jgi:RNA polymerase sigma-70 factor (ECF subfamily)